MAFDFLLLYEINKWQEFLYTRSVVTFKKPAKNISIENCKTFIFFIFTIIREYIRVFQLIIIRQMSLADLLKYTFFRSAFFSEHSKRNRNKGIIWVPVGLVSGMRQMLQTYSIYSQHFSISWKKFCFIQNIFFIL